MTQGQHRATARVLDILESLSGSEEGLTLTELSQALDAPKSSLFPIVHTLEERRYLRQDDGTGRYTMGPRALVLGAAFSADRGLAPITQVMKEVASKCQETCQMGILDQDRVLYVAREDSPQPIRLISWVGTRLPANATAVGKALLSGLTNEEVRAPCWPSWRRSGAGNWLWSGRNPRTSWPAGPRRCGGRERCSRLSASPYRCSAAGKRRSSWSAAVS